MDEELTDKQKAAIRWTVLDNLLHGWTYWTNLKRSWADDEYLRCVRDGLVRDGKISDSGRLWLMTEGRLIGLMPCTPN